MPQQPLVDFSACFTRTPEIQVSLEPRFGFDVAWRLICRGFGRLLLVRVHPGNQEPLTYLISPIPMVLFMLICLNVGFFGRFLFCSSPRSAWAHASSATSGLHNSRFAPVRETTFG